ncbi:EF-hand domain-containing protein, partial [Corynebacterium parakroppenstedtii]|uniref:EF-hand domain-containing protein n=1 Tax=Corynebacterium parakroppenstedtii TaxID=2828363 RepID=UPI001F0292D4
EAEEGGDAPAPASKPASQNRRAQRSGSNVFAMFTQHQVQEFKEAFQLIDQDKDGFISKNDIRATFDSLGRLCTEPELDSMMAEAPGPINFTMFLTIFGDRIAGTDEEDVIVNAFNLFDEGDGKCKEETLKRSLTTWGEKFSQEEVDEALSEAPIDSNGLIDIKKFANILTKGAEEEEGG